MVLAKRKDFFYDKREKCSKSLNKNVMEIEEKVQAFISSRENSNNLVGLISALTSDDVYIVLATLRGVQKVFLHLFQEREMYLENPAKKRESEVSDVKEKYVLWLHERYQECKHSLFNLLYHTKANIQELALCVVMKLISLEGIYPTKPVEADRWYFPEEFLKELLHSLLTNKKDMSHLITKFQEFSEYDDVKYYTLRIVLSFIKQHDPKTEDNVFCKNVFSFLSQIKLSNVESGRDDQTRKTLVQPVDGRPHFRLNYNNTKKIFSSVWVAFLKCKLSVTLYKKILILLHDHILPHFHKPLLLTDFLTESYNMGGAVSLLALNSLFFLIQKYNLEYPDFYKKLYALFEMNVLCSKYQPRFFFLSDLFLTSTHLPAYLVAAFCKRLSRLALMAPPNTILIILSFIRNLLVRHPNLKILLHKKDAPSEVLKDPYDADEPDPSKCKALESSLWELKTLQSHWHPDVQTKAKFIENPLPEIESDLFGVLELSISDMVIKTTKKKFKEVPLSYDKPSGLFKRNEDKMNHLWAVS